MSERGSFVTEYMYCPKCFAAAKKILLGNHKYLCSLAIPSPLGEGQELQIIAGKIGGLYSGEELVEMECELGFALEGLICHPVRVAVLSDTGGDKIFTFYPGGDETKLY